VTGAEKDDVVGFEFFQSICFGVIVYSEAFGMGEFWIENQQNDHQQN